MKTRGQSFTELVCEALGLFNVDMPSEILDTVERMRTRVNVMKRDAGLEPEHFVTEVDYVGALGALEGFWNVLASAEVTMTYYVALAFKKAEDDGRLEVAPLGVALAIVSILFQFSFVNFSVVNVTGFT